MPTVTVCARTQLPIPHIQFRVIITTTWKELVHQWFQNHTDGRLFCIFHGRFSSNKDSSDEIIGQSPVGNIVNFAIWKSAAIDLTQGAKVAGLSACPNFVTNGEHAHSPFTKNVPSWYSHEEIRIFVRHVMSSFHPSFDGKQTCTTQWTWNSALLLNGL